MTQPNQARDLLQSAVDRTKRVQETMREESKRIAEAREAERPQETAEEATT